MTIYHYLRVKPDTPTPLAVQLSQQLARLITSGEVPAGEKLPSVRKMAAHLGINLHTVRAAYQQLEADGLVVTRQRSGTRVLAPAQRTQAAYGSQAFSFTIGVLIPVHSAFYIPYLQGLQDAIADTPWLLHVIDTHDYQRHVARSLDQLVARNVDGIVAIHVGQPLQAFLPAFGSDDGAPPIVYADSVGTPGYAVGFDRPAAAYQATMHLLEHGHERIGFVTAPLEWRMNEATYSGFRQALKEAGVPHTSDFMARGPHHSVEAGLNAAHQLLDSPEPPSAIFAGGDTLAVGAIRAAQARGLRVPGDVAVVGFGGMDLATLVDPPLTTIHLPLYELGREAIKMLRRLIAGEIVEPRQVILDTELALRQSCGLHE